MAVSVWKSGGIVKPPKPINYPVIMKSKISGMIVLFSDEGAGVVLKRTGLNYDVGEYSNEWVMSTFEKFDDVISMQNEED